LKYLKIGKNELYAAAIIAFATGLRIFLIAVNWPPTNSDEGVMGIIALHIAYHGEHPLIFYGQDYMGVSEAYLAAMFFHLFGGPSLFALRLGVVLIIMFFFIIMYILGSLLFSKKLVLISLALLSVGSIPYLTRQTLATGGSAETLLFGSLAFLLAAWLSLTYQRGISTRTKLLRCAAYFALGLVVGLAIWSDMVAAPMIAFAGLLLLVFCWKDVMPWGLPTVVPGIIIGLLPSLRYSMIHNLNPITTLLSLFHGLDAHPPTTLLGILHDVKETVVVSIPTATGNPFCPVQELSFLSDNAPRTAACEAIRGIWGAGYLVLLGLALVLVIIMLWRLRARFRTETELSSIEKHGLIVRAVTRLMMLSAGVLTIVAFAISAAPVWWPAFHARYLITLLIILPAVIEPIWHAASKVEVQGVAERVKMVAGRSVLIVGASVLLIGTLIAFSEIAAARQDTQNYVNLGKNLMSVGVKNVKSDYWSCYNITFLSNERILCDVMTGDLRPGYNRPPDYNEIVMADRHAAYVFKPDSGQYPALMRMVHKPGKMYKHYEFNGYSVYVPQ
jgi:hypothetical protein